MAVTDNIWLKVDEAAALARVSSWSLYKAIGRGEIRRCRVGGRRAIRLRREDVEAWLMRHARGPADEGSRSL